VVCVCVCVGVGVGVGLAYRGSWTSQGNAVHPPALPCSDLSESMLQLNHDITKPNHSEPSAG
jgi:hypothetical protein